MRLLPPLEFTQAVARLSDTRCNVHTKFEPVGGRSTTVAPATLAIPSYRPHLAAEPTKGGKNHFELLLTDKLRAKGRARDADDD